MAEPARLYLDTARLGPMTRSAQLAARDFARLAGEGLSTLYCEQFLSRGWRRSDAAIRHKLPGLAGWNGLGELHSLVKRAVHAASDAPVLFASGSSPLFRMGARALFRRCRHVLTTDTLWPSYRILLDAESRRASAKVSTACIRSPFWLSRVAWRRALDELVRTFVAAGCDGLVVSSLSHDGVRLPMRRLLHEIRLRAPLRLAVVDGAQEFTHLPLDLSAGSCDVYLTGSHKWLGAYQPLGIALFANHSTAQELREEFECGDSSTDDALLRFLAGLGNDSLRSAVETVNLASLFSAWGALLDFHRRTPSPTCRFQTRRRNAGRLLALAGECAWEAAAGQSSPDSGLLLLQSRELGIRQLAADDLQRRLAAWGVIATAYDGGRVRFSLPDVLLSERHWLFLRSALSRLRSDRSRIHGTCSLRSAASPAESAPTTAGGSG